MYGPYLNTQVRQIQTVKLMDSHFDIWAGEDASPVNDNLVDDSRRNVSKSFSSAEMAAIATSMRQEDHSSTLYTPHPPSPKAHLYLNLSLPSSSPSQKIGGRGGFFPQRRVNSVHAPLPPSLSSNDFLIAHFSLFAADSSPSIYFFKITFSSSRPFLPNLP